MGIFMIQKSLLVLLTGTLIIFDYFVGVYLIDLLVFVLLYKYFSLGMALFVVIYYNLIRLLLWDWGSSKYIFFFPNLFALPIYFIILRKYGITQYLFSNWNKISLMSKFGLMLFVGVSLLTIFNPNLTLLLVGRFVVGYIYEKKVMRFIPIY